MYDSLGQDEFCTYLVHDNYYKDISHLSLEDRAKTNFDHPESLDTELLIQHVRDLKEGKDAHVPNYDFKTHSRTDVMTVKQPKPIVLIEGILIFSEPRLVELMDCKIFVDTDSDIRLTRRLVSYEGRQIIKSTGVAFTQNDILKQFDILSLKGS